MSPLLWYSARSIFQATIDASIAYEERIVLISALSFDAALLKAEAEARDYALSTNSIFTGYIDVYQIADLKFSDGIEIYSLLRQSSLNAEEYISRFFDTGLERCKSDLASMPEYTGSYLMEIAYGSSLMGPELASAINHLIAFEQIGYDDLSRRLTHSTLDKGEAYILGKVLAEKARELAQT